MKLLFDLNSLRPPRSGVGYYTQHLLEGLRDEPDVQGLAGWGGAEGFEGERLGVASGRLSLGELPRVGVGLPERAEANAKTQLMLCHPRVTPLELLQGRPRHARPGEHGEARSRVPERPRRRLDPLCAQRALHALDPALAGREAGRQQLVG